MSPDLKGAAGAAGASGLLRYVVAWVTGGALVIAAVMAFIGREDQDAVTLPPVRQIELTSAARSAGCELRAGDLAQGAGLPAPDAPGPRPLPAGVYDEPPDPRGLAAAVRRGVIVVQHRPDLPGDVLDALRALQKAVPAGTIVTPEVAGTRYEVTVTAWRRSLGCPRFSRDSVDAIRLFRGRFVGTGPDRRE